MEYQKEQIAEELKAILFKITDEESRSVIMSRIEQITYHPKTRPYLNFQYEDGHPPRYGHSLNSLLSMLPAEVDYELSKLYHKTVCMGITTAETIRSPADLLKEIMSLAVFQKIMYGKTFRIPDAQDVFRSLAISIALQSKTSDKKRHRLGWS